MSKEMEPSSSSSASSSPSTTTTANTASSSSSDDKRDATSVTGPSSFSTPHSSSNKKNNNNKNNSMTQTVLFNIELVVYLIIKFLPKFILEVWGGAGAIWGFSEVAGLRTPDTVDFWRPAAWTIGGLFLVRFLWQLLQAAQAYPKGNFARIETLASPIWDLELGVTTNNTADEIHPQQQQQVSLSPSPPSPAVDAVN